MSKQEFVQKIYNSNDREFDIKEISSFLRKHGSITMSWGYHKAVNYFNKALVFRVQGFQHKGLVSITLNGLDLFDVELLSGHYNSKKIVENVYIDSLMQVLDSLIETGDMNYDEYKKKVNDEGFKF